MPAPPPPRPPLPKCPTGIRGFDLVTEGGLPRGRGTLVSGAAGCGKTLFALEFLAHGAADLGEPGVFVTFRESPAELVANVRSFGWDVERLLDAGTLAFEHVKLGPGAVEAGAFDLDALMARIGARIASVGARRVALDTVEILYATLPNARLLRAEIERVFAWFKEQGLTAVLTAERVDGALSRTGIEEFVGDCVVSLEHRVFQQVSTRTLRVVKYRGSAHGTNEYPFVIDADGIHVLPITAVQLEYDAPPQKVPTGIARLDPVVGGGYFRGSTVLITGGAGTGKTSLAAVCAEAACARGERVAFLAFEESAEQIVRNMHSIGLRLERWTEAGLLRMHASRPTASGLEAHLAEAQRLFETFEPSLVVFDPVSSLDLVGEHWAVRSMLLRLIDFAKARGVTALMTSLAGTGSVEDSQVGISSMVDTWLVLRNVEVQAERTRLLYVLKARGAAHSNQVREFVLSDTGPDLLDVDVGPEGVLVGVARTRSRALRVATRRRREAEWARRHREIEHAREQTELQIAALRDELRWKEEALREDEAAAHARADAEQIGWSSEAGVRVGGAPPEAT